jgi:hypothetical protein
MQGGYFRGGFHCSDGKNDRGGQGAAPAVEVEDVMYMFFQEYDKFFKKP